MSLQTSPEQPAPLRQIAMLIEGYVGKLGAIWVEGQIAQINKRPTQVYLTLRDKTTDFSMTATCPRFLLEAANPPIVEGASVVVHGRPDYYPQRGSLSLRLDEIRSVGLGELLARLEQRRQLLAAEGLFDAARKRRLPFLPRTIGLVTGRGSAAERDVLENVKRRWPHAQFAIRHSVVQGANCAKEVVACLRSLEAEPEVDVIIVARGGGSVEDLLPFSDEGLIRLVSSLTTPVISAIGHEQDTPLLDLVADLRASTPTDAAKRVVPDVHEERAGVLDARRRAWRSVTSRLDTERAALASLRGRPVLAAPHTIIDAHATELATQRERGRRAATNYLDRAADDLSHARARVRALSPHATLARGYSVLQRRDGLVVTSVNDIENSDQLSARVGDGRIELTVTGSRDEAALTSPTTAPQKASDTSPHPTPEDRS